MIISIRKEGLANRLKSLVSCFRLDPDARIYWEPAINIYLKNEQGQKIPHRPIASFNDLFTNSISIEQPFPIDAVLHNSWRLSILPTDKLPEGFSVSSFSDADVLGRNIDFEYNRIPKRLKYIYIEEFKKLNVQPILLSKIEQKIQEIDGKYISVHLRCWSDVAGRKRRDNVTFDNFVKEMKSYKKNTKFFVGSDSDEAIQSLIKIFPNQIYYLDEPRTQQNDLIDLYLLSKGTEILGTKNSTLSEVTWWLSECNKHIRII